MALAGLAGLRLGEIRGLELSHLQKDTIVVCQQMNKNGETVPLKTDHSRREVPLHPFIHTLVKEELKRRKRIEEQLGKAIFTRPYVLVHTDNLRYIGKPFSPAYYGEELKKLIPQTDFIDEDMTMHAFRHSYGSNLIYAGVPIPQVSEWMGHADSAITLSVYTHVIHSMRNISREKYFETVDRDILAAEDRIHQPVNKLSTPKETLCVKENSFIYDAENVRVS